MKKCVLIIQVLLLLTGLLAAREKTVKIGNYSWYTEQNNWEDLLAIAEKENKPVLAYFTAVWCGPCKGVKKNVLETAAFKTVADRALLVCIEQTQSKSQTYLRRNGVRAFPTFKLFSPKGNLYENALTERSVKGLQTWITAAKSGKLSAMEVGGKTFTIGGIAWYTEYNSYQDLLALAKKEKKKLLMIFNASDSPEMDIKKTILTKEPVSKALKPYLPVYLDMTPAGKGMQLARQLNIQSWPTGLLLSPQGQELDFNRKLRNEKDFLGWMENIGAGKTQFRLKENVKKNPKDRKAMAALLKNAQRLTIQETYDLLYTITALNPDVKDPLSQEACERLVNLHVLTLRAFEDEDMKKAFGAEKEPEVRKILKAYYPDKFSYQLKAPFGYRSFIRWYTGTGNYPEAVKYTGDYLEKEARKLPLRQKITIYHDILPALLGGGQEKKAQTLLEQLEKEVETSKETDPRFKEMFKENSARCVAHFVTHYARKGDLKTAERFALKLEKHFKTPRSRGRWQYLKEQYAKKYALFADEVIQDYEALLKTIDPKKKHDAMMQVALVYARKGDKKTAEKYLAEVYKNIPEKIDEQSKQYLARKLFYLAKQMDETNLMPKPAREAAQKSVDMSAGDMNLSLLADIHAAAGNYKDAVSCQEKAIKLAGNGYRVPAYHFKIKTWKKKF